MDALVFSPKAKYVYIGRDGRDVVWSLYSHHANANDTWYRALNDTPGRVGPPIERPVGHTRVLAGVARSRRLSLLVLLGEFAELVGDSHARKRDAGAFREPEAGHAG